MAKYGKHDAGKGSIYRPVDQNKWDIGWLRIYGVTCPACKGKKKRTTCNVCGGIGLIEPIKNEREQNGKVD